jgi:glutamine synthetase
MLGTAKIEPLIRRIRNSMAGAGLQVENSKGECNFGSCHIRVSLSNAIRAGGSDLNKPRLPTTLLGFERL